MRILANVSSLDAAPGVQFHERAPDAMDEDDFYVNEDAVRADHTRFKTSSPLSILPHSCLVVAIFTLIGHYYIQLASAIPYRYILKQCCH